MANDKFKTLQDGKMTFSGACPRQFQFLNCWITRLNFPNCEPKTFLGHKRETQSRTAKDGTFSYSTSELWDSLCNLLKTQAAAHKDQAGPPFSNCSLLPSCPSPAKIHIFRASDYGESTPPKCNLKFCDANPVNVINFRKLGTKEWLDFWKQEELFFSKPEYIRPWEEPILREHCHGHWDYIV